MFEGKGILETPCPPFVSVIVPALNDERLIKDCLMSLLQLDDPSERHEVLVVDNGSTDWAAEIIKNFPVKYLRKERQGKCYARNRGIGFLPPTRGYDYGRALIYAKNRGELFWGWQENLRACRDLSKAALTLATTMPKHIFRNPDALDVDGVFSISCASSANE